MTKKLTLAIILAMVSTLFFYETSLAGVCSAMGKSNGCVTYKDLKNNAVKSNKIKNGQVKSNDLTGGAVTNEKLGPNSVTSDKIAPNAVGSSEVVDNSLTASDLATNSVGVSEIASGAVRSDEVFNNSLTADDLATNSVNVSEIASGAVGSDEVFNNSLTGDDIASNSISSGDLQNEAGIEFFNGGSCSGVPNSVRNCASLTVTAPSSGYVLVQCKAAATTFGGLTSVDLGVSTSSTTIGEYTSAGVLDTNDTIRRHYSMNTFAVFTMSAGSQTFYCNAQRPSPFNARTVNLGNLYMVGAFFPTRY
jgi:hypothetical protein